MDGNAQVKTMTSWRDYVHAHEFLSSDCQTFLDKIETMPEVKITRAGLIKLSTPIGKMVPYELCPKYVKVILRKICAKGGLPQKGFATTQAYNRALCNLYIYGYLHDIPETLMERRRYHNILKRRWGLDNPEALKRYKRNAGKFNKNFRAEMSRI
jgi:hypothetical protein